MYPRFIYILILLGVAASLSGCPQGVSGSPGRKYRFPGTDWQVGNSIVQRIDGGYFIAGDAVSGGQRPQVLAVKLDSSGGVEWVSNATAPFSWSYYSMFAGLATYTAQGSTVLVGHDFPNISLDDEEAHLRITEIDYFGNSAWDNSYGDELIFPSTIASFQDGGVAIGATVKRGVERPQALYLHLIGESLQVYNLNDNFYQPVDMLVDINGDLVFSGVGITSPTSDPEAIVCKVTQDGMEQWCRVIDVGIHTAARSVAEAPNGDLLLAGRNYAGLFLIRFSSDGEILWLREDIFSPNKVGESDQVWDVAVTPQGNIVIVGLEQTVRYTLPFLPPTTIIRNFIALLDPNGDMIWDTTTGSANLRGVTVTRQGTFMATGSVGNDLVVVEVDRNGRVLN